MRFVIITPFFNEEKYLENFIKSVLNQTHLPVRFILVNDNSTDSSPGIAEKYAEKYSWIELINRKSIPRKVQGSKVIETFNYGLKRIDINSFDYISKIDSDLELPPEYFSKVSKAFIGNPKIGIAGGRILEIHESEWELMNQSDYHIRGALKSYRIECFKDIDGLLPVLGWDGLDEMKAFKEGWESYIIDSNVKHYRPANHDYNAIKLNFNCGWANYKNGGNLFLATVRCIVRLKDYPFLLAGLSYYFGYLKALLTMEPKNVDRNTAKFKNRFDFNRILKFRRY